MKKIHSFKLAVPVLQVTSKVTHTTPRKPTVIESLILELAQYKNQIPDEYHAIPLKMLLEKILKIPNACLMVDPAIENLFNLKLIIRISSDLDKVFLRDLYLSDNSNSEYFIKNGQLPAQPQENIIQNAYHGVYRELIPVIKTIQRSRQVVIALPDSIIGNIYPYDSILNTLKSNKSYSWLSKTSEITNIEEIKDERSIQHLELPADINLHAGKLSIESKDEKLNEILQELPILDLSNIINKIIDQYNGNGQLISLNDSGKLSVLEPDTSIDFIQRMDVLEPLSDRIKSMQNQNSDAKVIFHLNSSNLVMSLPDSQPALMISFDSNQQERLNWNGERAQLFLPEFALPAGFQWFKGDLQGKFGHVCYAANLCLPSFDGKIHTLYTYGEERIDFENNIIKELIQHLDASVEKNINDESWQTLPVFWKNPDKLWQKWLAEPAKPTLKERFIVLNKRYQLLINVVGKPSALPYSDFFSWLRSKLHDDLPLSYGKLKLAIELVKMIDSNDKQSTDAFFNWLQENSLAPGSPRELADYYRLVSFISKIRDDSPWLTTRLLSGWLHECVDDEYSKVLDSLPLSIQFNEMHDSLHELKLTLSENWLRFTSGEQSLSELAKEVYCSDEHKVYRQKIRHFQRKYHNLIKGLERYSFDIRKNKSAIFLSQINDISEKYLGILEKKEFLLEAAGTVFIVDSCFLIKHPNLPKELKQGEILLIPRKVHDELDNNKAKGKKEKSYHGARKAIQVLASATKERSNIITIDADTDLLPDGYSVNKPDNLILSSALSYRRYDPIFLTEDKNLTIKARSFNIPTLDVESYRRGDAKKPLNIECNKESSL